MKILKILLLLVMVLSACTPAPGVISTDNPQPEMTSTSSLPGPGVRTTHTPDIKQAAQAFLDAWQSENYEGMYASLTRVTQDAVKAEDFIKRYQDVALNLTLSSLDYEILSSMTNPRVGQVAYRVNFHTNLVGDLTREMIMNLALEDGSWKIQWEDGMIMPELRGGNLLAIDIRAPARANIYDADGDALAAQSEAVALGIDPSQVGEGYEDDIFVILSQLTGVSIGTIEERYNENFGNNWYVPVGEASLADVQDRITLLTSYSGIVINNFTARYYFEGGIAPHITGYVQSIYAEDLEEYRRQGYRGDEKVGQAGLEKWGEKYLAGTRGAALYVTNGQGEIITRLAETQTQPSQAIYTTIDADLQQGVQRSITGFNGAVVVMERDTGRILAMASSPSFDPNLFEAGNYNSSWLLGDEVANNINRPLVNRATQGGYPLGSVFKLITTAAALESGLFTEESTLECGHTWNKTGKDYYDWTFEKEVAPSGTLTLPEGIMRSCNPWFYEIGYQMYESGRIEDITRMAEAFGLGSATGIDQVAEDVGNMDVPVSVDDAVQQAIGQSNMLVTPLQVARFIAAIGNGGTLYRPQVIDRIVPPEGDPVYTFEPEEQGKLPVSPETLKIIQDAMLSVTQDRRGTAFRTFTGLNVDIYGKTGTAQTSTADPHAWFAGYTDSPRTDKPNIAVVVIAEFSGEGSEYAAPIFRRVIEYYYDGKPGRLYPWESSFFETQTPTPEVTDTPEPPVGQEPQAPEEESSEPQPTTTPVGQ